MNPSPDVFRQIFDLSAIGLAQLTPEASFVHSNRHLQKMLGFAPADLQAQNFIDLVHESDREHCRSQIGNMLCSCITVNRLRHRLGHFIWTKMTITEITTSEANSGFFILSIQDISEIKQAEAKVMQSEQRFKTILDSISEEVSVWMGTPQFKEIVYINQGYERIWGVAREHLYQKPRSFLNWVHPDDRERVTEHFTDPSLSDWQIDYRIIRPDGQQRYLHDVGKAVYQDDTLLYIVGTTMDRTGMMEQQLMLDNSLSRLREAYIQVAESARRDGLTGILNRSALMGCIDRAYENFRRYGTPATLVFIDLNRFKEVNDNHGHLVGDQTLVALVKHLQRNIRQTDDISRYGGDEFVVLLNNASLQQAREFCQRVGPAVTLTLPSQKTMQASMSFGISELTEQIIDTEQWLSEADSLMYGDKTQMQ